MPAGSEDFERKIKKFIITVEFHSKSNEIRIWDRIRKYFRKNILKREELKGTLKLVWKYYYF